MIYLRMDGRIGNQLFMYSFARNICEEQNDNDLVIDDTEVLKRGYVNSLVDYDLPNVRYVHNHKMLYTMKFIKKNVIFTVYRVVRKFKNYHTRFALEKKWQPFFNRHGLILCENGYLTYDVEKGQDIFIDGYYQCDKYFNNISETIKTVFSMDGDRRVESYPGMEEIKSRNSVCISIKIQHNVGNSMYDVCNDGYWQNAIEFICNNVENPLFFICSDDVEYVRNNLIDCEKYDVIYQDSSYPVNVSLAVMSRCKHFVIGNTTFGWWAQYLSSNINKIVVAPSKWMKIDMPIDIYQNGWHLVEVE